MINRSYDENKLLKSCLDGDTGAFEAIVHRYKSLICAITYSAVGQVNESEELAQQAFVNAWKNLKQLQNPGKFKSWLISITRNVIKDSFKKSNRDIITSAKPLDNLRELKARTPEPVNLLITREQQETVYKYLLEIPQLYREPLVLFYRQQQSVRQVAELLEITEDAVRTRLSRGRKMLREHLTEVVEATISQTAPKKAFATAVIASIAGSALKSSAASAAGTAFTAGANTWPGGVMAGAAGKFFAIGAVASVITVGAVIAYKHSGGNNAVQTYVAVTQEDSRQQNTAGDHIVENGFGENVAADNNREYGDSASGLAGKDSGKESCEGGKSLTVPPKTAGPKSNEFEFLPRGVLSGIITDFNTLEPVEGVKVRIISDCLVEQYTAESDRNGMYFFENINKDSSFEVRLETNDYIPPEIWKDETEYVQLAMGKQVVRHFELSKGSKIFINVVDEEGKPVKDVWFSASYISDPVGRGPKDSVGSDRKGKTCIGGLKPAEYMVCAFSGDYALAGRKVVFDNYDEVCNLDFVMKKGISVEGTAVCSDGKAAGGWKVSAKPTWWHSVYCASSYSIQEDGSFELKNILPGDYEIGIYIPKGDLSSGIWSAVMKLPPDDGVIALNIPKVSSHGRVSISGTIKFSGGDVKTRVWLYAEDGSGNSADVTISKGQKNFTLDNLVPGLYSIQLYADGENKIFKNIKAPSEGVVLEVSDKKEVLLCGKVADRDNGKPVNKFKVRVFGQSNWQEVENSEGLFEIKTTGEKCRKVQIQAEGYALKTSGEIYPNAQEPTLIKLGVGGVVEGVIFNEHGKPVKDAVISFRYGDKYITDSDDKGRFLISDLTKGSVWLAVSHPGYAPEVKQIIVEEGYLAETEIVLKKGGIIEGYVYDSSGNPLPERTLYFLDENTYDYWQTNLGRLGSVITDSNGFYSISGMPEKLCYGFRHKPDKQLGVVCSAIFPKNGETVRLDFGGDGITSGRLLRDGRPVSNIKILVQGARAGQETVFTAYDITDSAGRFSFGGIPSGRRYFYWSIPGLKNYWAQWSELGQFNIMAGADTDLGDFNIELAEVSVRVASETSNDLSGEYAVCIQKFDKDRFNGRKVGQLLPRYEVNEPYVFSNVRTGVYEAVIARDACPAVRKVFEVKEGQRKCDVEVIVPDGDASLSGKFISSDSEEYIAPLILRSVKQDITMEMRPEADRSYLVSNIPEGDYIIGSSDSIFNRQSVIKEFSLKAGESMKLDVEIKNQRKEIDGCLFVLAVCDRGFPLAGADVWLEKGDKIIEPFLIIERGCMFTCDSGKYKLYAEYPGYSFIRQTVRVKPQDGRTMQEILEPLVVTMSKK